MLLLATDIFQLIFLMLVINNEKVDRKTISDPAEDALIKCLLESIKAVGLKFNLYRNAILVDGGIRNISSRVRCQFLRNLHKH